MVVGFDKSKLNIGDGGQVKYDGVVIMRKVALAHVNLLIFLLY